MKTKLELLSLVAALALLFAVAQDAAAEEKIHVQASFYPYYDFTRNVAGSAATVEQFLPLGTEAHDWEPSAPKVVQLNFTDVFVYNGLGIETYIERLAESDDLSHITFVKATEGLALISTTGLDETIRAAIEEYEAGHYTAEEAVEAIEGILDAEQIREVLEQYKSGDLTTTEALSSILDLAGVEQDDHDHDHEGDDRHADEETDEHGHDERDEHGHDERDEHVDIEGIRSILEEIHDGDIEYAEGLEAIHDLVGSDDHGHDDHGHDAHDHGAFDPHVWLDPVLAVQQVANIRDALMEADSDNAETYEDNAAAYMSELDELHHDYAAALSDCRYDTIVTFHGAFAYLVERYGFETVAIAGISGTETVTAKDIKDMIDYVNDNGVEYLLGDDILDARPLEAIAEDTDAQVLTLSPIEGISPEEFESGATYIGKMRENLDALKTALACQ